VYLPLLGLFLLNLKDRDSLLLLRGRRSMIMLLTAAKKSSFVEQMRIMLWTVFGSFWRLFSSVGRNGRD
jgi:hypothetical protein